MLTRGKHPLAGIVLSRLHAARPVPLDAEFLLALAQDAARDVTAKELLPVLSFLANLEYIAVIAPPPGRLLYKLTRKGIDLCDAVWTEESICRRLQESRRQNYRRAMRRRPINSKEAVR